MNNPEFAESVRQHLYAGGEIVNLSNRFDLADVIALAVDVLGDAVVDRLIGRMMNLAWVENCDKKLGFTEARVYGLVMGLLKRPCDHPPAHIFVRQLPTNKVRGIWKIAELHCDVCGEVLDTRNAVPEVLALDNVENRAIYSRHITAWRESTARDKADAEPQQGGLLGEPG